MGFMMKERVKEFFSKDSRKILLLLFILQLVVCLIITPNRYDDEFYIRNISNRSIVDFVGERYATWTSRVMIEFTLCFVLKTSKYLWIILQAALMTLIGYSLIKLFVNEDKKENYLLIIFLFMLYPLDRMSSAGWGATTVNYIWPFALGLFSTISIKKMWTGEKISWVLYILYAISLLLGCNQEQVIVIMFIVYVLFAVLLTMRDKKKTNKFIYVQIAIIVASLIFILTCPGNAARFDNEVASTYPEYKTLSFFDKVSLGITSTVSELIVNSNVPFIVLCLYIAIVIFNNYKDRIIRLNAAIPLLAVSVLGVFKDVFANLFPYYSGYYRNIIVLQQPMINASNYVSLINFVPLVSSLIVICSMIISLALIFKKFGKMLPVVILLIGFATRMEMAFSPTIFASTNRTFIYLEFAMLICAYMIWEEYLNKEDKIDKKVQNRLFFATEAGAILQYINVLIFVAITQL